jgi:hypothetical protein
MMQRLSEGRTRTPTTARDRRLAREALGPALDRCSRACADAYRAYRLARWSASDDALRPLFDSLTRERERFLTVLQRLGGPSEIRGSSLGKLRRVALEATLLFRRDDRLLIAECVRTERIAERTYAAERAALVGPHADIARDVLAEQAGSLARARAQLGQSLLVSATRFAP